MARNSKSINEKNNNLKKNKSTVKNTNSKTGAEKRSTRSTTKKKEYRFKTKGNNIYK